MSKTQKPKQTYHFSGPMLNDAGTLAELVMKCEGVTDDMRAKALDLLDRLNKSAAEIVTHQAQIDEARSECTDDLEIDDNPLLSVADEGVWVQGWIWVRFPEDEGGEQGE